MDTNDLLQVILVLVAIFLLAPLVMMVVVGPLMMWGGGVGLWWLASPLVALLIVVGVGYLLYRALRAGGRSDPAIEELRTAYARGELSDEEFETRYVRLRRDESRTSESREH